jgi:hypothetical protein
MNNPFRSLYATTQIPYDTAMTNKTLSLHRRNGAETGAITFKQFVDGLHRDGSQNRLRLDRQFLRGVALFAVDQTLFHFTHLFNGIEVRATAANED